MSIHEDWKDPTAPKPGMSLAVKVLLIVGGIGGFLLLLCCGGAGFLFWKAKDVFERFAITTDADEIQGRLDNIVRIDLPDDFHPTIGMELGVMRWVGFEKIPRDGTRLLFVQLDQAMFPDRSAEERRREMLKMRDQSGSQQGQFDMSIEITERTTREVIVRGEKAEFEFNKGTSQDGKAMRQVIGAFEASGGITLLNLITPEEGYDEAATLKLLESIRDPIEEEDESTAEPARDADDPANSVEKPQAEPNSAPPDAANPDAAEPDATEPNAAEPKPADSESK